MTILQAIGSGAFFVGGFILVSCTGKRQWLAAPVLVLSAVVLFFAVR